MANRRFNQFFNTLHTKPVLIDCNFIVDSTNGNGFGARALKGAGVQYVYMNTSAAFTGTLNATVNVTGIASGTSSLKIGMPVQGTNIPAGTQIASIVSSSAITLTLAATGSGTESITYQSIGSPNPGPGYILVQLQDCYNRYFGGFSGQASPPTGSAISTGLTVGSPYTIASLGSSTLAQWQAAGLPVGQPLTIAGQPVLNAAFIAKSTSIAGGGTVYAAGVSGIDHIEVIGDPNQTIISNGGPQGAILGTSSNAYLVLQCLKNGVVTAPNNNTTIGLSFYLSSSQIIVKGE